VGIERRWKGTGADEVVAERDEGGFYHAVAGDQKHVVFGC